MAKTIPRGSFVVAGVNAKRQGRIFRSIERAKEHAIEVARRDPGGAYIDRRMAHGALVPIFTVQASGFVRRDW